MKQVFRFWAKTYKNSLRCPNICVATLNGIMYATDYLLMFLRKKRMSNFTMQRRGLSLSTDIHHWINQFLNTAHSETLKIDEQKCFSELHLQVNYCYILLDSLVFLKRRWKEQTLVNYYIIIHFAWHMVLLQGEEPASS